MKLVKLLANLGYGSRREVERFLKSGFVTDTDGNVLGERDLRPHDSILFKGEPLDHVPLSCREVVEFATIDGARAVGLDDRIGTLTPGKQADLILLSTDAYGMFPVNNPYGAVVYNAAHSLVGPIALAIAGLLLPSLPALALALIWVAHIGFDRLLGYGLKYAAGFGFTHLGRIGRDAGVRPPPRGD